MNIAGYDSCIGRGVAAIRSKEHQEWINFFIYSNRENIYRLGSGSTFPNVSRATLSKIEIPIPPKNEQKRIVAILNEVFEGVDRAIANTKRKLAALKELGQSILQKAFSGELTGLAAGWQTKKLGDICENLDSKRFPITKSKRASGDIPYYGASGIVDYVSGYIFDEDLLLVSEDGANLLARTYPIAFSISGKTWVNNHAHVLRFTEQSTQHFVEYYLNSISLELYVSGMAQPKLNQKSLNLLPIPVPSLTEQKQIVAILDEVFGGIDRAIANTKRKLAALAELKQSILQKAFSGELTGPTANQVIKEVEGAIA